MSGLLSIDSIDRSLYALLYTFLKTAAKRRWGLGMKSPSGFGQQPNVSPVRSTSKRKSGSEAIPDFAQPAWGFLPGNLYSCARTPYDVRCAESRTAGRTASIPLFSLCGSVKGYFRMKTASISFSSFLRHFNTPAHANLTKESYNMRVLRRE